MRHKIKHKILALTVFVLTIGLPILLQANVALGAGAAKSTTIKPSKPLEFAFIFGFAIALCVMHIFSSKILEWMHHKSEHNRSDGGVNLQTIVSSLGGGIAVSYVFVHLLPELSYFTQQLKQEGDFLKWIADMNLSYYVTLLGFMLFYGLQKLADRLAAPRKSKSTEWDFVKKKSTVSKYVFNLQVGFLFVYNALIVYTIPEQINYVGKVGVVIYMFSMLMHLFGGDHVLQERHAKQFKAWGCYVLAAAPLIGSILGIIPRHILVSDIMIALLAGFILLNAFKEELPDNDRSSYTWFATGAIVFAALMFVAHLPTAGTH